jgi:hypothetical protein
MEWLENNKPKEEPATARPQHLKFCRDLMMQRDWQQMVEGMPDSWWKLFLAIKQGDDTFHGKPILRSDVNKLVDQLKKCPPIKKALAYERRQHNIAQQDIEKKDVVLLDKPPLAPPGQFAAPRTPKVLEDGMYRNPKTGTIYKLYHTVHGANVQVAKELIIVSEGPPAVVRFDYRGRKPLYSLTPEMRLTMEEAREFGALYGTCCICGRTLTNELSIHLGIGPVCGRREFGGEFEFMVKDARDAGFIDGEVISVDYDDEIAKINAEMKELEE